MAELDRLLVAAGKAGRHRDRDRAMLMLMYAHGLRMSEAIDLRWTDYDQEAGQLRVRRLKGSKDGTHELDRAEIIALDLLRSRAKGPFVFESERGGPMTRSNVNIIVRRAGELAKIAFQVTPHMLRHSAGSRWSITRTPAETRAAYKNTSGMPRSRAPFGTLS